MRSDLQDQEHDSGNRETSEIKIRDGSDFNHGVSTEDGRSSWAAVMT